METQFLRDIGLTDNEIRVYLQLTKQGEAIASDLSNRASINRTLTYQILKNLLRRGLVSYVIKNNIKYFKAGHPSKLLDFLKEKEQNIQTMIPELLQITKPQKKDHSVELYEGKEGLKTILNDIVRTNPKEFLDMTSGMTIVVLPKYYMDSWEKKRAKAKIHAKFLINDTQIGRKRGVQLAKLPNNEVKLMPKGLMSPSHIYIYGDKVGITLWEKEFPFAIVIKSIEISKRFGEFFGWFWKQGKQIK